MSFEVVIPARYDSMRLPGKPLADLAGQPMIVRVAEAAARSGAAGVTVATDDERVADACRRAGVQALMTRADHPSGSDRIAEVAERLGWANATVVLNVQGDEPLIPAEVIDQLAGCFDEEPELGCATLCEPITEETTLLDPNVVKVVRTVSRRALYFSRAPVPFARDGFCRADGTLRPDGVWLRHIGLYGFRVGTLRACVEQPVGQLETVERLEQLRWLAGGIEILVEEAAAAVPAGVDTPDDLERVRKALETDVL